MLSNGLSLSRNTYYISYLQNLQGVVIQWNVVTDQLIVCISWYEYRLKVHYYKGWLSRAAIFFSNFCAARKMIQTVAWVNTENMKSIWIDSQTPNYLTDVFFHKFPPNFIHFDSIIFLCSLMLKEICPLIFNMKCLKYRWFCLYFKKFVKHAKTW